VTRPVEPQVLPHLARSLDAHLCLSSPRPFDLRELSECIASFDSWFGTFFPHQCERVWFDLGVQGLGFRV
jgi:hypothetical protein